MKIFNICAEYAPWCRTGGLGDVTAALPAAIKAAESDTLVVTALPLYQQVREELARRDMVLESTGLELDLEVAGRCFQGRWFILDSESDSPVYFLESDELFSGPGLYEMAPGSGLNLAHRFGYFCKAAYASMGSLCAGRPDLLHLHDWHVAPIAWLNHQAPPDGRKPKSILTIHNLAFQGWFEPEDAPEFDRHGDGEHVSFLKLGIEYADQLTTVSPRYAVEIQTDEFGCGMEQTLCHRGVVGIVNGIDYSQWDPATDSALVAPYSPQDPAGRIACRQALLARAGWPTDLDQPIFGVVSRLAHQKGLDWVADIVPQLKGLGARLVLLGTGDEDLESTFQGLARTHPDQLHAMLRFDDAIARQIYAGADAFLVPSRFEPCGLTQLYAMRYGAVPVVNPVGGLRDTVYDGHKTKAQNGFLMQVGDSEGLYLTMARAAGVWHQQPERWAGIVAEGYRFDSRWRRSGAAYNRLYRSLIAAPNDELRS
ncbi:MAG: glycogen synthase [Myxococcales bacterium]|nr:glycogen synthase [Myxococcales bacterium]